MENNRPSWDFVWMETAKVLSTRSVDPRYKVGAIIVSMDNTQVLSIGYNGDYKSGPNEVESTDPGMSGFLHAEVNCLIKCDFNHHKSKKMYVTLSPCKMCAKAIINGGIEEVIYEEECAHLTTEGISEFTEERLILPLGVGITE